MNFTDCKKDEKINGIHFNSINFNNLQKRKMIEEEKRKAIVKDLKKYRYNIREVAARNNISAGSVSKVFNEIMFEYSVNLRKLFGEKTEYWKDEKEIESSFDPQYNQEDLKDWELKTLNLSKGIIQK